MARETIIKLDPNCYNKKWIDAINEALIDRGVGYIQITDITDEVWFRFISPLIDYFGPKECLKE